VSAVGYLDGYTEVPIDEIGAMESQWMGLSMDEAYHCDELRFDAAADAYARQRGHADARAYHEALKDHIRVNGVANTIGLGPAYDSGRFEVSVVNGQHRYFAARDLGLTTLPAGPNQNVPMPLVPGWDCAADREAV
jgi:hypothetical protein